MNQVKTGKTAHAYLFVGPRGTGKTTTARILAKAFNCKDLKSNGDPCDKCENCVSIKTGNFLDLIEIDAASNRGIDDIRDLKDRIRLAPSVGSRKVYIIDEVHMLTNEAFNALLKTLEEPPVHVSFILCTTELHKVPDTIKSRCQVYKFKRATVAQLVEKLSNITKEEKAKVSKEDLKNIAQASLGGFRDAETLLQQVVEGNLDAETLLNIGSRDSYANFIDLLIERRTNESIKLVNKIYDDGVDLYVWAGELIKYLRDLLFISARAEEGLVDTSEDVYEKMKKQAFEYEVRDLVRILESIMKAQNMIKSSFITQLPLELCVVEVCGGNNSNSESVPENKPIKPVLDTKTKDDKASQPKVDDIDEARDEKTEVEVETIEEAILEFNVVEDKWPEILKKMSTINSSVQALLKSGRPVSVEGRYLVLEVMYSFHKERLESKKNRELVEELLKEELGCPARLQCRVCKTGPKKDSRETGNLTDLNVIAPTVTPDNALDLFDGSLPLG